MSFAMVFRLDLIATITLTMAMLLTTAVLTEVSLYNIRLFVLV
jgi:hypothetical protein